MHVGMPLHKSFEQLSQFLLELTKKINQEFYLFLTRPDTFGSENPSET